jgi:hypothetical protein
MEEPSYPPDEFYEWVGKCIKEWASIEALLYMVYATVLDAHPTQLAIIFYRTPTLDARLSLIDELVTAALPQRKQGGKKHADAIEWAKLLKDIRSLLKTRNLLAYAPVGRAHFTEWNEDGQSFSNYILDVSTGGHERLRGRQIESIKCRCRCFSPQCCRHPSCRAENREIAFCSAP